MIYRLACLVSLLLLGSGYVAAAERPNILFFIADNWAWPHAGILGDPTARTPVFDRIVTEGLLFKNAFCPVPSCSPTRSCILTGRPAHQLEDAASLWSKFPQHLAVFSEALRQSGYEVGYTGKGWAPGNHLDFGWPENPVGKKYESFEEFLSNRDPTPFFFWHGNTDTSLNKWKYDPDVTGQLDPNSIRVPVAFPDTPIVRENLMDYYGSVSRIDADAGACIKLLESNELFEKSIFIYTSDNGWQMPRGLANCYDMGTRIPFAMRWGNRVEPRLKKAVKTGRVVEEFISLTDLAPTFLEMAGLTPPPEMTGRSFYRLIQGQDSTVARDSVFVERERHANVRKGDLSFPIRGIRTAEYLYLWNLRSDRWPAGDPEAYFAVGDYGDVDGSKVKAVILDDRNSPAMKRFFDLSFSKRPEEELYNLKNDPDQLKNVADWIEYEDICRQMRDRVKRWMKETQDPRTDSKYDAWDFYPYFGSRFKPRN